MNAIVLLIICSIFHEIVSEEMIIPPCTPSKGHTALIIGQDLKSIENYTTAFSSNLPIGFMAYTAITYNNSANLAGLDYPIDYGSGIEWSKGLLEKYPNASLQLGLYLVHSCGYIFDGLLDKEIDALATFLKRFPDRSIYLRIGYEFDSEENNYDPIDYIGAFRRISHRFDKLEVNNTALVWHASGFKPRDGLDIEDWFPGIDYVDWCGVSLFQQPYDCQSAEKCKFLYAERLASYCEGLKIPTMIAESTPFGGLIDELESNKGPNRAGYSGSSWNRWFVPVIEFIEKYDIRVWSYINCHWDAFPMWQKNHAPGIYWGDTRIERLKDLRVRWKEEVLEAPRFNWVNDEEEKYKVCAGIAHHHNKSGGNDSKKKKPAAVKVFSVTFLAFAFIFCIALILANCYETIKEEFFPRSHDGYTLIVQ